MQAKNTFTGVNHLVGISDRHAGSATALCTPEVELDGGGIYKANPYQNWLYERWCEFWEDWIPSRIGNDAFGVVDNGDSIEGQVRGCTSLISSNFADQENLAVEMAEPIRERASFWVQIRGTEAHVGKSARGEERVAKRLKAYGAGNRFSRWEFYLEFGGKLLHFAHHIGVTSSTAYETSALNRELVAALGESAQWGVRAPDWIVRSHRHRHSLMALPGDDGMRYAVVTPCWQLKTPFVYKKDATRLPQIGGLLWSYDGRDLVMKEKVWTPPRPKVVVTKAEPNPMNASSQTGKRSTASGKTSKRKRRKAS